MVIRKISLKQALKLYPRPERNALAQPERFPKGGPVARDTLEEAKLDMLLYGTGVVRVARRSH